MAEKYYSYSSFAYVMNNPVRYTDPTGMSLEDPIYGTNFWGNLKLIGDDGKNDGKIHIVTSGKSKGYVKSETDKGNKNIDLTGQDVATLHGGKATINGMVASVQAEKQDTAKGAGDATFHEEGGHTERIADGIKTVLWDPGPKQTFEDATVTIPMFNGVETPDNSDLLDYWHAHTSGILPDPSADGPVRMADLGPSNITKPNGAKRGDVPAQARMEAAGFKGSALQIDTRGSVRVNFYNSKGTYFSISLSKLKKL